jgi:hypothetical protein
MYVTLNVEPYGIVHIMLIYKVFDLGRSHYSSHECWDSMLSNLLSDVLLHGGAAGAVYMRGSFFLLAI